MSDQYDPYRTPGRNQQRSQGSWDHSQGSESDGSLQQYSDGDPYGGAFQEDPYGGAYQKGAAQPMAWGQPGQVPPPERSALATVFGLLFLVTGVIFSIGSIGLAMDDGFAPESGQDADWAYYVGAGIAVFVMAILPLVLGAFLLTKHSRDMKKWRRRNGDGYFH